MSKFKDKPWKIPPLTPSPLELTPMPDKPAEMPMPPEPANDNGVQDVVTNLAVALSKFMDADQVQKLVRQEIMEYSCLKTLEIKRGEATEPLPEGMRHYLFPEILVSVDIGIPSALIGPAGSGKSTVVEQIAKALRLKFYLQNGVTGTHELTGYKDAHGNYQTTPFRQCFEHGGVILIDEVDTSEAGALKWINTALANGHAGFPDQAEPVKRHSQFRIVIAANTFGTGADRIYVGANQLDASTLDRFVFFDFDYDEKLEKMLSGNLRWAERVQKIRKAAAAEKARVVVSPRATINGAKLLQAGWAQKIVEDRVIWKGMDAELQSRIQKKAA